MAVYNVSKIENWYDDFTSCKNKFLNTYAEDYKNSYIKACKDDIANKMRVSLNNNYNRINRIFNNIDKYWKNYLNDLKNTDNCLAGNSKPSSVTVSSVSSKLSQLPELDIYESDLGTKIESVSSVIGTAKGLGWAEDKTLEENLDYVGKRTYATIRTFGVSCVEGVVKLVEDLGDFGIITNAAISTIGTGVIDSVNYFRADLTGDESLRTNYTDQLWETTRAVVSQDITGSIFDYFYQNSSYGQFLQENAYGFDTVRAVGSEVGEVVGVVALSTITGGSAAVFYGVAKAGEHTEENWQDPNKGTFEGLFQGSLEGAADGLFFAIGAKGDKVFSSVLTSGSKSAGKTILSLLGKTAFESGTSVAQDFVNITVDALFLPDQVIGENNEIINLDTFEAKMNYSFDQAGGVNGILTSMGTAGMLSFMSDGLDAAKIMRNVDTNNALKNADINSSKLKDTTGNVTKQIDNLTSKINALDDNHINYFNDRIRKGNAVGIKVPSADDIPDNIWEKIDRPKYDDKDVWITTADGKKFYWGEDTNPNMLRNNNTNIKSVSTSANDAASSVKSSRPNTNIDTPQTSNIAAKNASSMRNPSVLNVIDENTYNQLLKRRNELLAETNKDWFKQVEEYTYSGYAQSFDDVIRHDEILEQINNIDNTLKNSRVVPNPSKNIANNNASLLQELKNNKSNLDEAKRMLNNWGKNLGIDNYAEQALRKYADTGSAYQNINGHITPYITNSNGIRDFIESLDPKVVNLYLENMTLTSSDINNLYNFFKKTGSSYNSTYGVDQGGITNLCIYTLNGKEYSYREARDMINNAKENGYILPRFKKQATKEYFDLKNKLISRGLTNNQASIILSSIDDVGACSYAAKANSIFYKFSNNPKLFEKTFGFPMYKINANGEMMLNSNELLLDMYLFANDTANGGRLFSKNYDGSYSFSTDNRIDVFGRPMLNTNNQVFMSNSNGSNNSTLSSYLSSKGLDWSSYNLITNLPNNVLSSTEFNGYIEAVKNSINDGKSVQLNIFSKGNEIRMINKNPAFSCTTKSWGEGGGHAIFITGMNNQGFIVSSWGREYLIPFSDLQNGGYFNIMIDDVY